MPAGTRGHEGIQRDEADSGIGRGGLEKSTHGHEGGKSRGASEGRVWRLARGEERRREGDREAVLGPNHEQRVVSNLEKENDFFFFFSGKKCVSKQEKAHRDRMHTTLFVH